MDFTNKTDKELESIENGLYYERTRRKNPSKYEIFKKIKSWLEKMGFEAQENSGLVAMTKGPITVYNMPVLNNVIKVENTEDKSILLELKLNQENAGYFGESNNVLDTSIFINKAKTEISKLLNTKK